MLKENIKNYDLDDLKIKLEELGEKKYRDVNFVHQQV